MAAQGYLAYQIAKVDEQLMMHLRNLPCLKRGDQPEPTMTTHPVGAMPEGGMGAQPPQLTVVGTPVESKC